MKQIIFLLSLIILSLNNYYKANFDWDLPAYMGCVMKKNTIISPQDLHKKVYDQLENKLSKADYLHIKGIDNANPYRSFVSKDAQAYYQQLRYYDIKELYIDVVYIIAFFVQDVITSIYLLNAICFVLFGFFVFTILSKYSRIGILPSYFFTIVVCILPFISNLARIASPDLMVLVIILSLCYAFINKSSIYYQILLTLIIVTTRPDYLLFTILYLPLFFFLNKNKNYFALLLGLIANVVLYFIIINLYNYPGWKDLFYDTFISRRLMISKETFLLTYQDYFRILLRNFINFKKITLVALVLLSISVILFKNKKLEKNNFFLIILFFFSLYLKFLLFPAAGEMRFFIVYLLIMAIFTLNPQKKYS